MADRIKTEPIEDTIDESNARVLHLLQDADLFLELLGNRSSINRSLASTSSTVASTSRDSFNFSNSSHLEDAETTEHLSDDNSTAEPLDTESSIPPTATAPAMENSNSNSSSDELGTRMQYAIQAADTILDQEPSVNNRSANRETASSSSNSRASMVAANQNIPTEQNVSTISVPSADSSNSSSDDAASDSTVLYSHDETAGTSSMSPIPFVDDSFSSEIIVVDPSTVERAPPPPRRRSRRLQSVRAPNFDDSVIDLSNITLPTPARFAGPVSQEVIVLSDDEQEEPPAAVPVAPASAPPAAVPLAPASAPPVPSAQNFANSSNPRVSVHVNGVSIEVHRRSGRPINMEVTLGHQRRSNQNRFNPIARQQPEHNYTRDTMQLDDSVIFSTPPTTTQRIPREPGAPLPVSSPRANNGSTSNGMSKEIICPICYESLVDRPALSTICGHLFCAACITRAQQLTKQCPMCKRKLPRTAQMMHPVYFTLS